MGAYETIISLAGQTQNVIMNTRQKVEFPILRIRKFIRNMIFPVEDRAKFHVLEGNVHGI